MKKTLLTLAALTAMAAAEAQLPLLKWAKGFGGASADYANNIVVDADGNSYITGSFQGTVDFDAGTAVHDLSANGASDAFLLKLNGSGDLLWQKTYGSTGADVATAIALEASGHIYLGGNFAGTADFDAGSGTENRTPAGMSDMFVLKLDAAGSFVWAQGMGGLLEDRLSSLSLDLSGNVLLAGSFSGTADMDPGAGTSSLVSNGLSDAFLLKLDASGSFMWTKQFGGLFDDHTADMSVDASGNIYLAGYFNNIVDFDPGSGASLMTALGLSDGFVVKLDASGNFSWARKMGGLLADHVNSVTTDLSGNIYVTGSFQGNADFGTAASLSSAGMADVFISRLDLSGNFMWTNNIGSGADDYGTAIVVNNTGDIYTTGVFSGNADFDLGLGLFDLNAPGGESDVFTQRLSPSGTAIGERHTLSTVLPYPNPNNGIFSFNLAGDAAVEIYSESGILVYSQPAGKGLNRIDVSNQLNGVYFVKMIAIPEGIAETHALIKF